jgi:hypothetical protein
LDPGSEEAKIHKEKITNPQDTLSPAVREKFLCVDPSCFLSCSSIDDLLKVLLALRENDELKNSKVLVPGLLYDGLVAIAENKDFSVIAEIFQAWLPAYAREHIEEIIRGLSHNVKYIGMLRAFQSSFSALKVDEFAKEISETEEQFITKNEVFEKYGIVVGKVLFEILSASMKLEAKIISFSRKTTDMIRNLGKKIIATRSSFKTKIKKYSTIKRRLRIIILIISEGAVSTLRSQGIDVPNGVATAATQGSVLILND